MVTTAEARAQIQQAKKQAQEARKQVAEARKQVEAQAPPPLRRRDIQTRGKTELVKRKVLVRSYGTFAAEKENTFKQAEGKIIKFEKDISDFERKVAEVEAQQRAIAEAEKQEKQAFKQASGQIGTMSLEPGTAKALKKYERERKIDIDPLVKGAFGITSEQLFGGATITQDQIDALTEKQKKGFEAANISFTSIDPLETETTKDITPKFITLELKGARTELTTNVSGPVKLDLGPGKGAIDVPDSSKLKKLKALVGADQTGFDVEAFKDRARGGGISPTPKQLTLPTQSLTGPSSGNLFLSALGSLGIGKLGFGGSDLRQVERIETGATQTISKGKRLFNVPELKISEAPGTLSTRVGGFADWFGTTISKPLIGDGKEVRVNLITVPPPPGVYSGTTFLRAPDFSDIDKGILPPRQNFDLAVQKIQLDYSLNKISEQEAQRRIKNAEKKYVLSESKRTFLPTVLKTTATLPLYAGPGAYVFGGAAAISFWKGRKQVSKAFEENPLASAISLTATTLPFAAAGFIRWGRTPVVTTKTLRSTKEPILYEISQPVKYFGKDLSINYYIIKGEKTPPTVTVKTTKIRNLLRLQPKSVLVKGAQPYVIKPLEPTILGQPYQAGFRQGRTGKVIKISNIEGGSRPLDINQLNTLSPRQRTTFERLLETRTGGRPVSQRYYSKILGKETRVEVGEVLSTKIGSVKKSPKRVDIKTPEFGKETVSRAETITTSDLVIDAPIFKRYTTTTAFQDVSKPGARVGGKVTFLKGTLVRIKDPIVIGEDIGPSNILLPSGGKKVPLSKTFLDIKQEMVSPKPIPKIPKGVKGGLVTTTSPETGSLVGIPRMVGGTGLTESQLTRVRGGTTSFEETVTEFPPIIKQSQIDLLSQPTVSSQSNLMVEKNVAIPKDFLKVSQKTSPTLKSSLSEKSILAEKTGLIQKSSLLQQSSFAQTQRVTQIRKQQQPQPPRPPRIPPPRIPKIEELTPTQRALLKLKGQGVDVIVGMKTGKQKTIAKNIPPNMALKKGRQYVDRNIEASFKIVPTGKKIRRKDIKASKVGNKFRPSKTNALYLVEKRKYRLDSPGEKRQIKSKSKSFRRRLLS